MHFDLNLKQLKVFYYVARHLSFTKAAEELFVTQPAVTMQIDALERHYGTRLFTRERKNLSLTEAGAMLYSYAERIMILAFEADQAMLNLKMHPHGVLRIGTTKTWARVLMPGYILRFQEKFPELRIQLDEGSSDEMALSVVYGRNDLAIVGRVDYDERLEVIPFPGHEKDEVVFVVPPDHPLAGRETVTMAEVAPLPLLLREQGSGIRRVIVEHARACGVELNVMLEASSVPFIKDLIRKGAAVSILTRISVEEELRAGTLKAVSFAGDGLAIDIDLVVPRGGYRSPAVRSFLEFLRGNAPPAAT